MAPVLGSIFFTVVMAGAGTSLLASLAEARDALRPMLGDGVDGIAARRRVRTIAVRRPARVPASMPQRAAA